MNLNFPFIFPGIGLKKDSCLSSKYEKNLKILISIPIFKNFFYQNIAFYSQQEKIYYEKILLSEMLLNKKIP